MANGFKKFYKRKYKKKYKKKYKSRYSSRLRDSKINTLVEKRMQEIAQKEAMKVNKPNWIVVRGTWNLPQAAAWPALEDQWPPIADFQTIDETQFHSHELAKCGGYLNSEVSDQLVATGVDRRSMYLTIKEIRARFHFVNTGAKAVLVDFQIVRMPYDKMVLFLSQAPQPSQNPHPVYQDHRPFTSLNTISKEALAYYKQPDITQGNFTRRVQLLARKRIVLPPPKMIDNPGAGGADRLNTLDYRSLNLNKFWKGLGKKERYQIINGQQGPAQSLEGSLADARYFFSIRVTGACRYIGVTQVKFAASHILDRQLIFDRGAPQAQ